MSDTFENILIDVLENVTIEKERVDISSLSFFVCGGLVDARISPPPSFRDRFFSYTAKKFNNIHESIVLAENFKDYFKENAYPDLLIFEEEIANISSLVIIFLESPGSLVELGMFCNKPKFYKKLLIVAPQDEIKQQDSFIYLGPLENIRKKEETSVAIYPWPDSDDELYEEEHLIDLCELVEKKISSADKSETFNRNNSGHIALLIVDIVTMCFPILISEIELALTALNIDINSTDVSRHIYLLSKLELIGIYEYSGHKYYYPIRRNHSYFSFVRSRGFDAQNFKMKLRQSFATSTIATDRKRRSAYKEIKKMIQEA